jgi:hypothetical protein
MGWHFFRAGDELAGGVAVASRYKILRWALNLGVAAFHWRMSCSAPALRAGGTRRMWRHCLLETCLA